VASSSRQAVRGRKNLDHVEVVMRLEIFFMIPVGLAFVSMPNRLFAQPAAVTTMQVEMQGHRQTEGSEVVLFLGDGERLDGELLSVRDDGLLLGKENDLPLIGRWRSIRKNEFPLNITDVAIVHYQEIQGMTIKGKSRVLEGAVLGAVLGGVAGAVVGYASGDDRGGFVSFTAKQKAEMGGFVGALLGLFVGGVHASLSTEDQKISSTQGYDFSQLKEYARFPNGEPEFLQMIK
jgi:hypothetical protein